eukprot:TRINITY_DN8231_c0_g1_i1.p1 TRINITY_DN8231_c0_g1~~TRINITY_DN8231_c0_g1_i1.p1  ORF type:complete len:186 (-),score=24.33 TRINITY_DN8231_c0_g1_i1:20-577(-)
MNDLKGLQSEINNGIVEQTLTAEKRKTELIDERDPKKLKIEGEADLSNEDTNNLKTELPELPVDIWKIITDCVSLDDFLKLIRLNSYFSKIFRRIFDEKVSGMFPELSREKISRRWLKEMWELKLLSPSCYRIEGSIVTRLPWDKEIVIVHSLSGDNRIMNLKTRESINMGVIAVSYTHLTLPTT